MDAVRFGSKDDMCAAKGHVCFTLESGHVRCTSLRMLRAIRVAKNPSARFTYAAECLICGDCLASLEPGPIPLPALWHGRKRAKINLAVGGFQIVSNVATLSVQKAALPDDGVFSISECKSRGVTCS
jgi:hypothetical protein